MVSPATVPCDRFVSHPCPDLTAVEGVTTLNATLLKQASGLCSEVLHHLSTNEGEKQRRAIESHENLAQTSVFSMLLDHVLMAANPTFQVGREIIDRETLSQTGGKKFPDACALHCVNDSTTSVIKFEAKPDGAEDSTIEADLIKLVRMAVRTLTVMLAGRTEWPTGPALVPIVQMVGLSINMAVVVATAKCFVVIPLPIDGDNDGAKGVNVCDMFLRSRADATKRVTASLLALLSMVATELNRETNYKPNPSESAINVPRLPPTPAKRDGGKGPTTRGDASQSSGDGQPGGNGQPGTTTAASVTGSLVLGDGLPYIGLHSTVSTVVAADGTQYAMKSHLSGARGWAELRALLWCQRGIEAVWGASGNDGAYGRSPVGLANILRPDRRDVPLIRLVDVIARRDGTVSLVFPRLNPFSASQHCVSWIQLLRHAADLACAVSVMHAADVVHLDIKLDNILVHPAAGTLVLTDLDLSLPAAACVPRGRGTGGYRAPELESGDNNGQGSDWPAALEPGAGRAADVWATGVVLGQLFCFVADERGDVQDKPPSARDVRADTVAEAARRWSGRQARSESDPTTVAAVSGLSETIVSMLNPVPDKRPLSALVASRLVGLLAAYSTTATRPRHRLTAAQAAPGSVAASAPGQWIKQIGLTQLPKDTAVENSENTPWNFDHGQRISLIGQ